MKKKILALVLALAICVGIVGCGGDSGDNTNPSTSTEPSKGTVEKITDFGGYDFVIADWYTLDGEVEFTSSWAEFVDTYQKQLQKDYNFTYKRSSSYIDGDYTQFVPAKIMAGDTDVKMYYFFEGYILPSVSQNLLWDLNELDSFDPTDPKWNQNSVNTFTINGGTYAVEVQYNRPLMGCFYNKRILEEAGLDPDLPYNLQAEGKWNWDSLEEICAKVTQDTNKDGVTDIWAWGSTYGNFALTAAWSNGASFVKRDETTGKYIDGTNTPEFLEAMEWMQEMTTKGYLYTKPAGGSGSYAMEAFRDGKLAFLPYNFWAADDAYLRECVDDWGWVYLPYGDSAEGITMCVQSNGYGIPKSLSKDEAEKVFQIFDLYTDLYIEGINNDWTIEGADEYEETYWIDTVANSVRDTRSVDETLQSMLFNNDRVLFDYVRMIPGYNYAFTSEIVNLRKTPQEAIESFRPGNQAAINTINNLLGFE